MSEIVSSRRFKTEKSNFSQTCTMLSQYLKENGTFGDLTLGINRNFEPNGVAGGFGQRPPSTETPTMDLFPQKAGGFASNVSKEQLSNKADVSVNKSQAESAQMTIFYGGQVIVFDDFPANKAKEIMVLASKSSQDPNISASDLVKKAAESNNLKPSNPNGVPSFVNNVVQERVQRPPQPIAADLPIARKASLSRFLEKRKDRINAKEPYQTGYPKPAAESNSWIGIGALQMNRQL